MATAIAMAVTVVFVFIINSLASYLVQPLVNLVLEISLTPLSVPIVSQLILWSQICALFLTMFVRLGKGVWENVLQKGMNKENGSTTQWLFGTMLAVACVALMPVLCDAIISFGQKAFSDFQNGALLAKDSYKLNFVFPGDEFWDALVDEPIATLGLYIVNSFISLFVMGFNVAIAYSLFKRQFTMLVVSIASAWVSVKAATDSVNEVIDILVSLLGLVLIQVVQFVFYAVAIALLSSTFGDNGGLYNSDLTDAGTLRAIFLCFASMGTALGVPQILERYAFSSGRSGAGNMIVGMGVRSGMASPTKLTKAVTGIFMK